jgi:protein-disulfide isomerase
MEASTMQRETFSTVMTAVLVLCALTVTGFVARRELGGSRAKYPPAESVADWTIYHTDGQRTGPAAAAVTIVEFSDFMCAFCREFSTRLTDVRDQYPNSIALIYRHFPLPRHGAVAEQAAMAAECAGDQGRFHAMHDSLFAWQDSLGVVPWRQLGAAAGVADILRFARCLTDSTVAARVRRDFEAGRRLGVRGTPTILVNDMRLVGAVPTDTILKYVRIGMARAADQREASR